MKIISSITRIYENRAKRETLERLRNMSNRQLLDCGISPDLLKEGVKAWPWRELPDSNLPLQIGQMSMFRNTVLKLHQDGSERQDAA